MIDKIKYYIADKTDPYTNLAIEKYLFDTLEENSYILYLWQNDNTVVIGKNQNPWAECRCSLLEEEGGHIARRLSGGGAVYHDLGNLNFTFIASGKDMDTETNNKVIMSACNMAGIACELSGRNDILAEGRKFSGNAFFNSKGRSYHHGTLLISSDTEKLQRYLTPSASKLEAKGVKSVKSRVINLSELSKNLTTDDMARYMIKSFEATFGKKTEKIPDIPADKIQADTEKYRSWEYIYGSTFPFSVSVDETLPEGNVNILIRVENGIITATKTYTDSLDTSLPDKIDKALTGRRFGMCSELNIQGWLT